MDIKVFSVATLALFSGLVALTPAKAGPSYGLDGNFQTQGSGDAVLNSASFCYFNYVGGPPECGTNSPWTGQPGGAGGGGGGMIVSGSYLWGGLSAPNSEGYFGFVQMAGTLSDTFTSTATGDFTLSWLDTNRAIGCQNPGCAPENYQVTINSIDLGMFTPATFNQWSQEASATAFQLNAGTSYTITFAGLNTLHPGWDDTAFIDDLALTQVQAQIPEPGTFALFGMALLAMGGLGARRKLI